MNLRLAIALLAVTAGTFAARAQAPPAEAGNWRQILSDRIPLYGHRNWIVIADSAYPAQSRPGIETVLSGESQIDVLKYVLNALSASKHVKPIVYTDQELTFLKDSDVAGVSTYREQMAAAIGNQKSNVLPHEQIIAKLDAVSQTFRVLIIKTNMTIPYTSVFLQLDCAYWDASAETRLRATMAAHPQH